jgi:monothiol glutaredoxin
VKIKGFLGQGQIMNDVKSRIEAQLVSQDVVLFMKGTAQFPMCGFSGQVVQILNALQVPFHGINVLEDEALREGIKEYANWPTIPQLYIKGEFIGGCDITREMYQSGELKAMLAEKGIVVASQQAQ